MGKPASRTGDFHSCPAFSGAAPHVGGPILSLGIPNVIIGGQGAAKLGDVASCAGPPDSIITGSANVLINGKPAARVGDQTAHGGVIVGGDPRVLIG